MENDNKKQWSVYVHIVPKDISGYNHEKYYVGMTCKVDPNKRWENGFGYRGNKHFFRAIEKYGWNNIRHEIVATGLTHNDACNMEVELIKKYDSKNPRYGYNKTDGGDGTKGVKVSDKTRKKRSENSKGEKNHYYGKKHSEEVREKMSLNHYDCFGGNNPRAKTIHQFDLNWNYITSYPSSRDAARELGCTDGMGSAAIHHRTYFGSFWAHDDNIIIDELGYIKIKNKYNLPKSKIRKEVFQFSKDGEFISKYVSVFEANKITGVGKSGISGVARKKKKTSGGYIWRYIDDVVESEDNSGSFCLLR